MFLAQWISAKIKIYLKLQNNINLLKTMVLKKTIFSKHSQMLNVWVDIIFTVFISELLFLQKLWLL